MNNTCVICLEDNNKTNSFKCDNCNNIYHNTCINKLKNNICPLCRVDLKKNNTHYTNYNFNNMDSCNYYDIQKYLNKWDNTECFTNAHYFNLETLGNWDMKQDLSFTYTCMHVECVDCNKIKIYRL